MELRIFILMIVLLGITVGCDQVESSSPEHSQSGLGADGPTPSKTNALGHGASSSHPQTFGESKFSPKGGYAPTYESSSSDDDKDEATKKQSEGY